jgi:digeranylgeranylglycerophospholipid reductase
MAAGVQFQKQALVQELIIEDKKIGGVIIEDQALPTQPKQSIRSKVVIAADGVESRLARKAGICGEISLREIETCFQYYMEEMGTDNDRVMFYFGEKIAPGGYIWVFPRGGGLFNVGIGITGQVAKEKGPRAYLDEFLAKSYPQAKKTGHLVGGVPVDRYLQTLVADGFMVAGDAARQVNALNGGGITMAMIAGEIAGTVAARCVRKGDTSARKLKSYQRRWKWFGLGRHQLLSYRLKEIAHSIDDSQKAGLAERLLKFPQPVPWSRVLRTIFRQYGFNLLNLLRFWKQ